MRTPRQVLKDINDVLLLPKLSINLMHSATVKNDPFYGRIVQEFYDTARRRHRKFPLIRALECGVAVCVLPGSFDEYVAMIEASARRNVKKAERLGYEFRRIDYNRFLEDIAAIRRSADVRQGEMPKDFLNEELKRCTDPATRTPVHDYAYFGIVKDDQLQAYAGCLVSGELFMIEQLYGHAAHQSDGIVPMVIVEMVRYLLEHYPRAKYYAYGAYFGATATMRRFKRKFGFQPYRVEWKLG